MKQKFFRSFSNLFLVLAIPFAGVASALAADGALDPTFGTGGKVITDVGICEEGSDVAVQPDGKIVMVGFTYCNINHNDWNFTVVRYSSDGSLDTSFDSDGIVVTDFGGGADLGNAVTLQSDGKIVVAGNSYNGIDSDFALVRYNSDGSLDTTFDADGKVTTDFGSEDSGNAVSLQPDGKIIVAGNNYNGSDSAFALARYNSDGSLDTTFGTDGKVTTDFSGNIIQGHGVAVQPDGKIVVAGFSDNGSKSDFALARYNNDGSLDTTFDTDGKVTNDFGSSFLGFAIALQPDGKIFVAGGGGTGDFALARYNNDGSVDTTFGTDGIVTTDFSSDVDSGRAVALQPDGRIVVAGYSYSGTDSNPDFALARYNTDGSLDTTFDSDGKVTTDFDNGADIGTAVAIQPDGKIVVAGWSANIIRSDFVLARYDVAISATEVAIDVKPGRFPNRIQLEKHVCKDDDNLYVAILTTPDFDALTVDASSLELGNPQLSKTVSPVRSRARDVDLDGDMDMALTFPLCKMIQRGVLKTSTTELILTGTTIEGIAITGRDSVKVVRED